MTKSGAKSRGLGRGLSALMADVDISRTSTQPESAPQRPDRAVAIEHLHANPDQPRRSFNDDALAELAASIREKGIIQPLIVRKSPTIEGSFEIVAGERRWRAAQIAQLHEVPVILREFDDTEVLEVAISENIQRADLNPIGCSQRVSTTDGEVRSHPRATVVRTRQEPQSHRQSDPAAYIAADCTGHAGVRRSHVRTRARSGWPGRCRGSRPENRRQVHDRSAG